MDLDGEEKISGFDRVRRAVESVVRDGYSAVQILSQVSGHSITSDLKLIFSFFSYTIN